MQDGKNRRRGPWSRFWRRAAVAFLVPVGLALAPGPSFAAVFADPFHGLTPLSEGELAELRGGFIFDDWVFSFGATVDLAFGTLATQLVLNQDGLVGALDADALALGVVVTPDGVGNVQITAGGLPGTLVDIGLPLAGVNFFNTNDDFSGSVLADVVITITGTGVAAFFVSALSNLGHIANIVNDAIIP